MNKKIFILLIFIILAFNLTTFCQVYIGGETGLNFSKEDGSVVGDNSSSKRNGLIAGAFMEVYLMDGFSFQYGFKYIQKGSSFENNIVQITQNVNYLDLPLKFNIRLFTAGKFKPFISGGIYYGIRLISLQQQEYHTGEKYEYDLQDMYDNSDFGFTFGLGLNYKLSKKLNLFTSIEYATGAVSILQDEKDGTLFNRGFQLTAGVKIRL